MTSPNVLTRSMIVAGMTVTLLVGHLVAQPRSHSGTVDFRSRAEPEPTYWQLSIATPRTEYRDIREATFFLTVKNVGSKAAEVMFPVGVVSSDVDWIQMVRLFKNGATVPERWVGEPGCRMTTLKPGWQVSVVAPATLFYDPSAIQGLGNGTYRAQFRGDTFLMGHMNVPEVSFVVDASTAVSTDSSMIEYYLRGATPPGVSSSQPLWDAVLREPSDPRWLKLLGTIPDPYVDRNSITELIQHTTDLGVKRQAIHALRVLGEDSALAGRLDTWRMAETDSITGWCLLKAYRHARGLPPLIPGD